MSLNFLPTELETIIMDYKEQMETREKSKLMLIGAELDVVCGPKTFSLKPTKKAYYQSTYVD